MVTGKPLDLKPHFLKVEIVEMEDESQQWMKAKFQETLNGNLQVKDEQGFSHDVPGPQYFFDAIHPVGTGKSITVTDAVLNRDANGKIQSVGLEMILYWDGPLQSGTTTFKLLYDLETDQPSNLSVVRSDGITRQFISDFANGFQVEAGCTCPIRKLNLRCFSPHPSSVSAQFAGIII